MSLIATAIVLHFAGRSLNVLSMMGMMLGIGLLVDDAIVVLESIVREHGRGIPAKAAAITGARAVSGAVIASTVTTAVVFLRRWWGRRTRCPSGSGRSAWRSR